MLVGLEGDVVKTLQSIKKGIALLDERRADLVAGGGAADVDDGGWADEPEDEARAVHARGDRGRPTDGPLTWNVAGLLADAPGCRPRSRRRRTSGSTWPTTCVLAAPIDGPRPAVCAPTAAILADADLDDRARARVQPLPARTSIPLDLGIEEEYLPTHRPRHAASPLPIDDEPDVARLTDHHELDLEPPVREAIQLAEPIAPLCRPDCPGLCIVCGRRSRPATTTIPTTTSTRGSRRCAAFRADDG